MTSQPLFESIAILGYNTAEYLQVVHQDTHAESVEVDMATNDEPAKISCPCCQATLVLDRATLGI